MKKFTKVAKYDHSVTEVVERLHSICGTETYHEYPKMDIWVKEATEWLSWRVGEGWDDSDNSQYASLLRCMALLTIEDSKKWIKKNSQLSSIDLTL